MATKTHSYTSKISYSSTGSSYTDITDCRLITPPNMEVGDVDTTHLESASAAKEYIAGWLEGGEVPFEIHFHKTQFDTIRTIFTGRTTYYWKITLPLISGESTPSSFVIQGHVKSFGFSEISSDSDDTLRVPITVKVTGLPTFTAGS